MTTMLALFALAISFLALAWVVAWRLRVACRTYEAYQDDATAERARSRAEADRELLEVLWRLPNNALGSEESA